MPNTQSSLRQVSILSVASTRSQASGPTSTPYTEQWQRALSSKLKSRIDTALAKHFELNEESDIHTGSRKHWPLLVELRGVVNETIIAAITEVMHDTEFPGSASSDYPSSRTRGSSQTGPRLKDRLFSDVRDTLYGAFDSVPLAMLCEDPELTRKQSPTPSLPIFEFTLIGELQKAGWSAAAEIVDRWDPEDKAERDAYWARVDEDRRRSLEEALSSGIGQNKRQTATNMTRRTRRTGSARRTRSSPGRKHRRLKPLTDSTVWTRSSTR